ncbi:MAG: hypothetical protein EOO50_17160 [Flavobacterium sp.]|uniref:5'-nucleotidase C-terminal domain-containing protein n=1 Tax=Flavobacterium sp. TaxID=239 RepID=UPI00121BDDD4|nr:5'-nucleotidase [Flavobacterium sp.]RZJ63305.1 MAG: hypothetical protein EOO50_17160 [Flavobacterium sp.]
MTQQWSVKLKNYNVALKRFGLFLTFATVLACGSRKPYVANISGREIPITDAKGEDAKIAAFIRPYHDHIEAEMNTVLAVSPQTLDKSGQWQTSIGNLFADVTKSKSDSIFFKREGKHIDFVMLNAGGVRSIIPKGNVTMKTAFEIMPFENSVIVAEMHDAQIMEMLRYIISEKKPHPISGIAFTIGKDNSPKNIMIAGKPYDAAKTYYVATNDYLYMGGDNMLFFAKSGKSWPLDYKLRNVLIDYFKEVDVVPFPTDLRISVE